MELLSEAATIRLSAAQTSKSACRETPLCLAPITQVERPRLFALDAHRSARETPTSKAPALRDGRPMHGQAEKARPVRG